MFPRESRHPHTICGVEGVATWIFLLNLLPIPITQPAQQAFFMVWVVDDQQICPLPTPGQSGQFNHGRVQLSRAEEPCLSRLGFV